MPYTVKVSDATGTVLAGRSGSVEDHATMIDEVMGDVTRFIRNNAAKGLLDPIVQPLTISYGHEDA